jgi:hypothetical protein
MIDKVKPDVERAPTGGSTGANLVVKHMEVVITLEMLGMVGTTKGYVWGCAEEI